MLRASMFTSTTDRPNSAVTYPASSYTDDLFNNARPSSAFLGPPTMGTNPVSAGHDQASDPRVAPSSTITYHGVCLTVWSHADAERTTAIRRTLEAGNNRSRKESAQSLVAARLKSLRADAAGPSPNLGDISLQARRRTKNSAKTPWGAATDAETDAETDGGVSESDYEVASMAGHTPGESTLFLPVDSVFWLPYALSKATSTLHCTS
jgi:nicotinamide N-methyltransferase